MRPVVGVIAAAARRGVEVGAAGLHGRRVHGPGDDTGAGKVCVGEGVGERQRRLQGLQPFARTQGADTNRISQHIAVLTIGAAGGQHAPLVHGGIDLDQVPARRGRHGKGGQAVLRRRIAGRGGVGRRVGGAGRLVGGVADTGRRQGGAVGCAARDGGDEAELAHVVVQQAAIQRLPIGRHARLACGGLRGGDGGGRDALAAPCTGGQVGHVEIGDLRIGRIGRDAGVAGGQGGRADGQGEPCAGLGADAGQGQVVTRRVESTDDGVGSAAVVARGVVGIEGRRTRIEHAHLEGGERRVRAGRSQRASDPYGGSPGANPVKSGTA